MRKKELKLYVWEGNGVLEDYGTGLICVLAYNLTEAKRLGKKSIGRYWDFPTKPPKVITEPQAFNSPGSA